MLDAFENCWSTFDWAIITFVRVKARTQTDENTEGEKDFIVKAAGLLRFGVVFSSGFHNVASVFGRNF